MFKKISKKQSIETLTIFALCMVIIWLFTQISGTVSPIIGRFLSSITPLILGVVFAFMLNPFVEDITKRFFHGYKLIGIVVTCIIIIAALIYVIYPIIHDLFMQSSDIIAYLSNAAQSLLDSMKLLNENIKTQIINYISSSATSITQLVLNSLNNIVSASIQTFLTFVVMIFALLEYDRIIAKITSFFSRDKRKKVVQYIEGLEQQLYFYLRSLVLGIALLVFVFGIVLHYLSINNAWSFAIIMSLLIALIPVLGPLIATIILAIITIPVGTNAAIIGFIVLAIFMQVFVNVISPKIYAQTLDLSNLLIISSFMIGFALLGIPGALFAVPAVIIILYTYHFFDKQYHWSERK